MKIIKRSGSEVTFDISKIMAAVSKANMEVVHSERLSEEQIETISNNVDYLINNDITSTSTKNTKAKELGIKIISENDLLKLINS